MKCIEPPTPLEPPVARPMSSAKPVSGCHAQCQRLAVTAVGVGLDVALAHRRDGTDRDGLLALAQMGRALDEAAHEQLLDLLLEQSDGPHLVVPADPPVRAGRGVGHRASTLPGRWWACASADRQLPRRAVTSRYRFRVGTVSSLPRSMVASQVGMRQPHPATCVVSVMPPTFDTSTRMTSVMRVQAPRYRSPGARPTPVLGSVRWARSVCYGSPEPLPEHPEAVPIGVG